MSENKGGFIGAALFAAAAAAIAGAWALTRSFKTSQAERGSGKEPARSGPEPEWGRERASQSRTDGKNEVDK